MNSAIARVVRKLGIGIGLWLSMSLALRYLPEPVLRHVVPLVCGSILGILAIQIDRWLEVRKLSQQLPASTAKLLECCSSDDLRESMAGLVAAEMFLGTTRIHPDKWSEYLERTTQERKALLSNPELMASARKLFDSKEND